MKARFEEPADSFIDNKAKVDTTFPCDLLCRRCTEIAEGDPCIRGIISFTNHKPHK